MQPETLVHFVVFLSDRQPVIEQLEGTVPNKSHGAVTPVKAKAGEQTFACGLNMRVHAGKLYEGATHHGTGDPQFANCPHCKETKEYKEAIAEHERHTSHDRGVYSGIFSRQGTNVQGGAARAVGGSGVPERPATDTAPPAVLPTETAERPDAVA